MFNTPFPQIPFSGPLKTRLMVPTSISIVRGAESRAKSPLLADFTSSIPTRVYFLLERDPST